MALRQTEPTEVRVGGRKFYITPFAAFKAANLTGELASVLAPILAVVAPFVTAGAAEAMSDNGDETVDVDVSKAAQAMSDCNISGDKLEKLMRKLLLGGNVVVELENDEGDVEPVKLDYDTANEIFCGEVYDMFALCFHVIKLNFGGFFKRLGVRSGEETTPTKTPRKIL